MDEQLTGLDPSSILKVRTLLSGLEAEGTTILLSSLSLSEIDEVTNHVLFLKNKQIQDEYLDRDTYTTEKRYLEVYDL